MTMMMNFAKKSAVDGFIKLKGTKSFLKHSNPFSLGLGFGPHLIHSSTDVIPGSAQIHPSNGSALQNTKCLEDVSYVFNKMIKQQPLPNAVEFTQLLQVVAEMKHYSGSLGMFKQLRSLGVFVDNVETVIKCCCLLYRTNEAFSVLGCNLKQGGINIYDVYTFNILLDGLIFEDRILEAQTLFEKLVKQKLCEPNLLMYNTMIKGLCSFRLKDDFYQNLKVSGPNSFEYNTMLKGFGVFGDDYGLAVKRSRDAAKLLEEMDSQQGISPDVVTYNSLISAVCKLHIWRDASFTIRQMSAKGIDPNVETFNIVVNAFCNLGKIEEARLVLYYMHEKGVDPNHVTFNSIIDALCLKGDMISAKELLNLMMSRDLAPDVATYISFLNGYCITKNMDEAMLIYNEMCEKGLRPDYDTYNTMVRSLFSAARFGDGRKLLDEMRGQGQMLDGSTYRSILVNLFIQNQAEYAISLFLLVGDSKLNSDIFVYNHLITGAIKCGKPDIAMDLFSDLRVKGMKPTNLTYIVMIDAFSREDLLDDAKELLLEMEESGYKANDATYNCLLGGYLRNKRYDDAEMLLHKMDETGNLNGSTVSLLRKLKAAGSLDPSLSKFTVKLAPKAERDFRATMS